MERTVATKKEQTGLRLPAVLGSHMVVQREVPVSLWGWAKPGAKVSVTVGSERQETSAGADGAWQVKLAARPAGGPHEIVIASGRRKITLSDVLCGDLWLCSGQSNMEFTVAQGNDARAELADSANQPLIRLFRSDRLIALEPKEDCPGMWQPCGPVAAASFSAVGYFFGRHLAHDLGVPIGLIDASWGGTVAEAWTPLPELEAVAELAPMVKQYRDLLNNVDGARDKAHAMQVRYEAEAFLPDPGNKGLERGYAQAAFDDGVWKSMDLPGAWPMAIDGAVWFRREIDIPAAWAGKKLELSLGAIDDFDVTYFNGVQVGTTGIETKDWWMAPRNYVIPAKLVKPGRAVLAVRVFDRFMTGGMTGPAGLMRVAPAGQQEAGMALHGPWKFLVEFSVPHERPTPPVPPVIPGEGPNSPSVLYNAMLHALRRAPIKGAIWYQGESNADRAAEYRTLLPTMIRSWRKVWGVDGMPFGIVQLANYMPQQEAPVDNPWAHLREAQAFTAQQVPNCGLAVAIDVGDAEDIHPKNKQDVGRRLALWALAQVYGKKVESSVPVFESVSMSNGAARVKFAHVASGLTTRDGGAAAGFAVAGADRKFVWAQATIEGDCVVLHSREVPKVAAVRYAWAANPRCNLYNKEGLPAAPFRTDSWPQTGC